ncbi:MAG: hydroxyethylthiazole kinase [Thermaerobacter sp.]|jgi:hydroxyethylthiazole kinase|nr:hydroxyethylthiazole kinase [Thermaerobacter sp.]MDA8144659.1 hydroxyethylthiazole kinase [Thermaerobacter sp.]
MTNGEILEKIRADRPLVHHITNQVTISECANVTLALGALPVMADAPEEVVEMVALASALVLNIGTLSRKQVDTMLLAGREANRRGVPVVLDPVGAGATALRTESAKLLLRELEVAVVKGNAGEMAILAGGTGQVRGVESVGAAGEPADIARDFARNYGTVAVVTGPEDAVSDGRRTALVGNGHPRMGTVVGTGCMAASVLGAFCACDSDHWRAAVAAMAAFGLAGERAAGTQAGPGAYKAAFFDAVHLLTPAAVDAEGRVRELA